MCFDASSTYQVVCPVSRPRVDPDWRERALELRESGLNIGSVARELGLSYDQVYYQIKREKFATPPQVEAECERCGRQFSRSHRGDATKCPSCRVGNAPVEATCVACGDIFEHYPSEGKRKYCSRTCIKGHYKHTEEWRKQMSERNKDRNGRKNPNFKGGRQAGYATREMRREFNLAKKGERECRVCGSHDNMNAHHAVPRSISPAGRADLRNCLPLCGVCHSSWHRQGKVVIHRDHFTETEWNFITTLIGSPWLDKRYPDRGRPFRREDADVFYPPEAEAA